MTRNTAIIGGVVAQDLPNHALVVGNPAPQIAWVSEAGERLNYYLVCPRDGTRYAERHEQLARLGA